MLRDPYCQRESDAEALRRHGCTLFSDLWLRRWAANNDAAESPVSQDAIDKAVWDLQRDSGATMAEFLDRGTKLVEAEVAFEKDPFAGRVNPQMRLFRGGNIRTDLIPLLEDGACALCCVDNGVLVDAGKGIGPFRGGHAVVVGNPSDGQVDLIDPLRKQTIRLDIDDLEKAMERFGSKPWLQGRGEFGVVFRSPTYLELARTQRDAARAELVKVRRGFDNIEAALFASNKKLAACEAKPPVQVPTDPEALAAARAQGIKDAAANAAATK